MTLTSLNGSTLNYQSHGVLGDMLVAKRTALDGSEVYLHIKADMLEFISVTLVEGRPTTALSGNCSVVR